MAEWWKKSVVYQVYPQSFKDSNNDGTGDLNGIREKLPYIQQLGADVIWLNPIYESPMIDNGYDIANYRRIDPRYGTLEDFQALVKEAHELGIKIVMDLVVNHTSDQHEWFQKSRASRDGEYADFYIWKDPAADGGEPNNWGSTFGGPAWTYVPERGQYYLHCFARQQPDLNWDNPAVRQAVYSQMKFWLDMGVDGFRMDVITLISKDPAFPDNHGEYAYTKAYYAGASYGPHLHDYLKEMNEQVLSHYDVMTVGEAPDTTVENALSLTIPDHHELNMVFQFEHMHLDYGKYGKFSNARFQMPDLRQNLAKWQSEMEKGWNSLYWNNHDQPRAVTRFGSDGKYRKESAKMLGTVLHMMKGTPYILQGEEIGMKDVPFESLDEYRDIETLFSAENLKQKGETDEEISKILYLKSRDNARTPMPWNGREEEGYGFSRAKPWIAYSPDNKSIHVEEALADPESVFYHYQNLIRLRKELSVITEGSFRLLDGQHPDIFAYEREDQNCVLSVIASFADREVTFEMPEDSHGSAGLLQLSNYHHSPQKMQNVFTMRPFEALIYLKKK